jgi:putative membrane-bound dehydrogenase-like protein
MLNPKRGFYINKLYNMKKSLILFLLVGLIFQGCANKTRINANSSDKNVSDSKEARRAEVLFLGHHSKHHDADKYAPWLAIRLFKSGVNMTYTTALEDLNTENLSKFDGIIIYANHESIAPEQEAALKNFVEGGKALIPLHSAAGCFKNSEWYINALGGQFKSHGEDTFSPKIVKVNHPVMKGLTAFETWDETYVHQNINKDITVLMERVEGNTREPYTWVRQQGKGRVFYTAFGHDERTWTNKGFLDLVNNGVLWALGDDVNNKIARLNIPDVNIYPDTISAYTKRHVVPKVQDPLTAAESKKLIQVPPGFEIELFAAEPDITNPIAMAWDERGRLWIVESVDYPNTYVETDGAANDRIKICEDTDGDGKADKFTIFADKLNIATSMVFTNGGVIVAQAPDFVFLKDTDGDDKADVREVIMKGWGKGDTHAGPSNLQYGFDNKIWGVLGYAGYDGNVNGEPVRFGQGVYRFNSDGKNLEYLASSSNNTWGLGITEDNNVFVSTANNTHSAYYSMPYHYMKKTLPGLNFQPLHKIDGHYDVHTMTPNLRQVDVVGGFTSAAGHHFYSARSFPKEYWNRIAFITEPTVKLIHNAIIEPDGAGFKERDGWNFLASSDEWVGPVHAEVGPDGALWVADWYNFVIQHNVFVPAQSPTEFILPLKFEDQKRGQGNAFISPLRDLDRGRVYRVVYKGARASKNFSLSKDNTAGLLAALESDNKFWRMTAQRLLVEKKDLSAIPALVKLVNDQKVDEIGLNGAALHALWTLHGIGALDGKYPEANNAVIAALKHPAAGVRKAAVEVMPKTGHAIHQLMASGIFKDNNLNTRLAAMLALATFAPSDEIGNLAFQASLDEENGKDQWLAQAIYAAAIKHRDGFIAAYQANSGQKGEADLNQRIFKAIEQEVFALERGNRLGLTPNVAGKEISFKAKIEKIGDEAFNGLILAQGNQSDGYGIFIQEGKVVFQVNQAGKSYKAVSSEFVPNKSFDIAAQLLADGTMNLDINDKSAAKAKAAGLFKNALEGGLRIGSETEVASKVAAYQGNFPLKGDPKNALLDLKVKQGTSVQGNQASGNMNVSENVTVIKMSVVKDVMQFDKKLITVKAGQKVRIELENPDGMQHNMLIIKPGSLQKVGNAADEMLRDPQAAQKHYVPNMPEVLHATKLLNTGDVATLEFTVPNTVGDYPYVCTFPGHWRGMNGIMKVVK